MYYLFFCRTLRALNCVLSNGFFDDVSERRFQQHWHAIVIIPLMGSIGKPILVHPTINATV